jgi:uroporphyrinogen-III synthase
VTRPAGRGKGLSERLEALGARVDLRPTITFGPPADRRAVRRAVRWSAGYDWIVITSPTGVKFFLEALAEEGCAIDSDSTRFAVVGPGTARGLTGAGVTPSVVATKSDADGLAAEIEGAVKAGEKVLVVRPEESREVLPEALAATGAEVDAVVFYRTVPAPECPEIARDVGAGLYDAIVFTSPSTFHALADPLRADPEGNVEAWMDAVKVAIGTVTADAMRRMWMHPTTVASRPTDEGLTEALVRAFER